MSNQAQTLRSARNLQHPNQNIVSLKLQKVKSLREMLLPQNQYLFCQIPTTKKQRNFRTPVLQNMQKIKQLVCQKVMCLLLVVQITAKTIFSVRKTRMLSLVGYVYPTHRGNYLPFSAERQGQGLDQDQDQDQDQNPTIITVQHC